jgi:Alpha amylase, catalytic domain/ABC transporter substrate binding protein
VDDIKMEPMVESDELWFKDAIIYQLHVKAFADSNNDGIGDFAGLTEKLDYLEDLGVTALWLLPFYLSPGHDDGYDISDYRTINADFGTMADFRRFMQEAKRRKLRVLTELVINHTSDQHPWFQRARQSKPTSDARNWYVWSDNDEAYAGTRVSGGAPSARRGPTTKTHNARTFITLLGGAAAWSLAARAQQPQQMRRVGVLMGYPESDAAGQAYVAAFREGLQKLGWAEGRNNRIDFRWVAASDAESNATIREGTRRATARPHSFATTPTTTALLQQTRTIPIVFATVGDPVGSGFVTSFPRPGGTVTGFNISEPTMTGKLLELLKEIAPRVARVAMLFNPATATYAEYWLNPFKAAESSSRRTRRRTGADFLCTPSSARYLSFRYTQVARAAQLGLVML